jgi:predicted Rossmann-fold nucleotide-binding protein
MLTWTQLGLQNKPVGLINIGGYFDALLAFLEHSVAEGFIKSAHGQLLIRADSPADLMIALQQQN